MKTVRKFFRLTRYFIIQSRRYVKGMNKTPGEWLSAYRYFMKDAWHDES